jgi:hypothetical protein
MPLIGLYCPGCNSDVAFSDAPDHFEECSGGVMAAEAVAAMVQKELSRKATRGDDEGPHLSPSKFDPLINCRRESYIRKNYGYRLNPFKVWAASEGTLWHKMFANTRLPGWKYEIVLPGPRHEDHPNVVKDHRGFLKYQLGTGVCYSGAIDKLSDDGKTLVDFKTKNYPWTFKKDQAPSERYTGEWIASTALQLNAYRVMAEDLLAIKIEQLFAWRMYRGCRRPESTWKKFEIPYMSKAELVERVADYLLTASTWNARGLACDTETEKDAVLEEIPEDGQCMFNGKKCPLFCDVERICKTKAGREVF